MLETRAPLVVVGSTNIDLTIGLNKRPQAGETVIARTVSTTIGGKGANQALAAARTGTGVHFITAIGPDATHAYDSLHGHGIQLDNLVISETPTGQALVMVTADGENSIVVIPGANNSLTAEHVGAALDRVCTPETVVLLQCEIPADVVTRAIETATSRGARVVLNLAPYIPLASETLAHCNPLVVNETEASALSGMPIATLDDAYAAAHELSRRIASVVITLGGDGAVVTGRHIPTTHVPGEKVTVVDTTGAGDAFVGTLAAALTNGEQLLAAARAGNAAGAHAVQHRGAQPARPAPQLDTSPA
jgi:ribokinase